MSDPDTKVPQVFGNWKLLEYPPMRIVEAFNESMVTLSDTATSEIRKICFDNKKFAVKKISNLTSPIVEAPQQTTSIGEKLLHFSQLLKINNPFSVKHIGAFKYDSAVYLVMNYVNVLALESANLPAPLSVISQISCQILFALKYLHQNVQIIHRNICPRNILMEFGSGTVKICDYTTVKPNAVGTTFVGDEEYMSPERRFGTVHNFSADIWSLGIVVAQCAHGYYPLNQKLIKNPFCPADFFENVRTSLEKTLNDHQFDKEDSEAKNQLIDFVLQCCIFDQKDRPSAVQLLKHEFITKFNDVSKIEALVAKDLERRVSKQVWQETFSPVFEWTKGQRTDEAEEELNEESQETEESGQIEDDEDYF